MWALVSNGVITVLCADDAAPDGTWTDCGTSTPAVGDTFTGGVATPTPATTITATAFLNRFNSGELSALAGTTPTLLLLITCAAAGRIDLTDPAVQGGINGLTSAGILTPVRAAAILTP